MAETQGAHRRSRSMVLAICFALGGASAVSAPPCAADPDGQLTVATSGGTAAALRALAAVYARGGGERVRLVFGPSMGETPQTIPARIARGERIDVVVMVGSAVDRLADDGQLTGPIRPVACSHIAMAVRAGAPRPDISTLDSLRRALLEARSVAYSDSASGVFVATQLFPRLGVSDTMRGKAFQVPAVPVGEVVAQGRAELGFQQLSELLPVKGIDVVGLLPSGAQLGTTYSGAAVSSSAHKDEAESFLSFLGGEQARGVMETSGLEQGGCPEPDQDQDTD
ncbi:substrate-binding domain-containing protein [Segniliparus rotundus]|nr:substrate-binding domain-containing protein [Segniliparus rotundus]